MAQKMKKSVSELQKDLAAANKQIKVAKESGNKRQLNIGRQQRIDAWRELRDEHGMEPPSHIAKALGAPKKKEPTEFTKPKEETPKEEVMVFTTVEIYGAKEATRMAEADRKLGKMLAKMTPKQKKEWRATQEKSISGGEAVAKRVEMPEKKASAGQLSAQVRAWLENDPNYKKARVDAEKHEAKAKQASEIVRIQYDQNQKLKSPDMAEEVLENLDRIVIHKDQLNHELFNMERLMEKKKAAFEKEHASNPALVKAYSAELAELNEKHGETARDIGTGGFSKSEQRIVQKTEYNFHKRRKERESAELRAKVEVNGENRLQKAMKSELLDRAQELLDSLEKPTEVEEETMGKIRGAASNPKVDANEMLKIALGEGIDEDTAKEVELALLANTVDNLETRVAVAEGKKPVKIASRGSRKEKKGPVKVASLERKKREKEV